MSAPALGQSQPSTVDTAKELAKSGHPEQALALVDPIIEQAMLKDAKDPRGICPGAAAAFLQGYMQGKFTVTVQNDWCDAMLVKGYALNELKRPAEAGQVLEALVGHAPNNPNYLTEYAYAVRVNGDLERSLRLYQQAESIATKLRDREAAARWRAVALRGEGYALSDLHRWDEATKAYQRSLKYAPGDEVAQHELLYIKDHRSVDKP